MGKPKLTEAEVIEIKNLMRLGFSDWQLSVKYGVLRQTINHIRTGRRWSNIGGHTSKEPCQETAYTNSDTTSCLNKVFK
jgi:hypothetical protein